MVDIALELPDELIEAYEVRSRLLGIGVEELMRRVIEESAPRLATSEQVRTMNVADEPIVKAAEIEKEYRRLGYSFGWRFITCPQAQARTAKLLLISLNPAGREKHGPSWSQEEGSAYRIERWGNNPPGQAPLQRQVQLMFEFLNLADDEVFSAHYVPFRSPSWSELAFQDSAKRFATQLWQWLLPKVVFDRVICIGKDLPGRAVAELLGARLEVTLPVGWGEITADRYRLSDGRPLIALPHLSRFGVFGRAASRRPLEELFCG